MSEQLAALGAAGVAINIGEAVPLSCEHEERVGRVLSAACAEVLASFPTSIADDEAALERARRADAPAAAPEGRLVQALHSRLSRKRCLAACRDACDAWAARPTAMASLRRPWRINIRTSG